MSVSASLYVRLQPQHTGLFRFLLEAYDNLAFATTLDRNAAILAIQFAQESYESVQVALAEIRDAIALEILIPEIMTSPYE